jgi:ABC-type transporter Mla subunit MlaD
VRATWVFVVLCAVAAPAAADSKTKELARGYEKELAACQTRADGVTKVAAGAQGLVDDGQKQHDADLAALRAGLTQMQTYCAELTATLEILGADPNAKYRSLERKLDDQDNKIRKLRQSTKKLLDDLAPVISRLIPSINARVGSAAPAPKKLRLKLHGERAVDGPALGGTFRTSGSETTDIVEYTEAKASATLTTTLVAGATCAQQRQAITADASDIAATDAIKALRLAWYVTYAKPTRRLRVACRMTKAGAIVATLDDPLAASAWPELEPLLLAMIAARP